jgi:hypothetical protein
VRVRDPLELDFVDIGEGMLNNNVGVEAITLEVQVSVDGEHLELVPTEQRLRLDGDAPEDGWTWLLVQDWDEPEITTVRVVAAPVGATPGSTADATDP